MKVNVFDLLSYPNEYPYTGNGFTAGYNGNLGVPELYAIREGSNGLAFETAIIGQRLPNGQEEIVSIFADGGFYKIK